MRKNSYKIFVFILVFLIIISGCNILAYAKDYGDFSIKLPDEYISVVNGEDKSNIAEIIGIESTEVESYFEKNNILLLSVDRNNNSQIKLSVLSDDFSSKILSFNNLDNTRLVELANSFFMGDYELVSENTEILENNNLKFLKYTEALKDSGGEYIVTQLVTVFDGKTYRLSVITTSEHTTEFVNDIIYSFSIKEKNTDSPLSVSKILIASGIIVFSSIIIYTVIGIIKTYKKDSFNKTEPLD